MADYIEGKRPVLEALRSEIPLRNIFIYEGAQPQQDGVVADICRKAKQRSVEVRKVSRKRLDDMSNRGNHQGVIAEARDFRYAHLDDVIARAQQDAEAHAGRALVVVCDHLTDAGNLGAIARSAESVGASGLVIPNKRSAQITAATYKSSAGAVAHIPVAQVANISRSLNALKDAGFWAAAATEHTDQLVWETDLRGRIALVMGNEQEGVSRLALETCDMACALPQAGKISSLNVAQAATVFMYEWLRQNYEA